MLLSVKLKNQIKNIQKNGLEFYLKNIRINNRTVGCSGFIKNIDTGAIVYVNTEKSSYQPLEKLNLYRTAKDLKDYQGGRNLWSGDSTIAQDIINLLKKGA